MMMDCWLDQKSRVLSDNFEESFIVGQEKVMKAQERKLRTIHESIQQIFISLSWGWLFTLFESR